MPLDPHISVFAEPAFEPRNVLSLRGEATSRRPRISRQASTRQVLVYTKNKQPVTTKETAEEDEEDWIKFPRTTTLLIIGVVLTTVAATSGEHLPYEVQTTTTPLSPKISPAVKFAHGLGLPDNTGDGVRSPRSRMSTLSV